MRLQAMLLVYLVGTGFAFRGFVYATALFLWNDIFQPLQFARSLGLYPTAHFVTAVLILAYSIAWFRGEIRPRISSFLVLFMTLILWMGITTLLSPFGNVAVPQFVEYLKYLLPLVFIHTGLRSTRDIRILAAVLAGSVGAWAAQAGAYVLATGPNTEIGIPISQMADRNDFAAGMVGTIPILFYFMLSYRWKFKRGVQIAIAGAIFLTLSAIVLSLSRGASVGIAAQIVLFVAYVSKRKIRDALLLAVAVGGILLMLPQSWYDRMSTINVGAEQTESSAMARMNLLQGAYRATLDHPITGLGPGGWLEVAMAYCGDNHNPHNIFLMVSAETGLPGLAIYLIVMIFTYFRIIGVVRAARMRGDHDVARLATALITCIFGLLSAMTFLNRPFNEFLWAWLALANALPDIYARESREGRKSSQGNRNATARGNGATGMRPAA